MSYEELICFNKDFSAERNDFYGPYSPLSRQAQTEYLHAFLQAYRSKYGEKLLFKKAVSDRDIHEALKKTERDKTVYSAYTRPKTSGYKGWHFYTDRAFLRERTVVLSDDHQFPVPCAKYEFDETLKKALFRIKIEGSYYHKSAEGILPTTTGRYIEFRKGCEEIIKLYFSPDGRIFHKDGREKKYQYQIQEIGQYPFDRWFEIELEFFDADFAVRYEGERRLFAYGRADIPDTLFFSGGMQPVGKWELQPTLYGESELKLFQKEIAASEEEYIGEVTLPFAIGTERNKDKILILKRAFVCQENYRYTLELGALDPGGDVYINGKHVRHFDDFQPHCLDITPYIRTGENELALEVTPRAPEVLYAWHRHDDYYNGWFALEAKIHEAKCVKETELIAYAQKIGAVSDIVIEWTTGINAKGCRYRIFLEKCYPRKGEKRLVAEGRLRKQIKVFLKEDIEPWDIEEPTLYTVTGEIYTDNGIILTSEIETGFRTIRQKNGALYLNGRKIVLKGALNMQFLPPYEEIPVNHLCPTDRQIVEQVLAVKNMNGNCLRMHQLGYGSNDRRFARICDRLGILLIWTTRLIDSAENLMWTQEWKQKALYQAQMRYVIHHPSIIMWEGSNELHTDRKTLDTLYDEFVVAVKEVDKTRLICPVSHLYYGGGIYDYGCEYYDTAGERDESLRPAKSSFGWRDELVVRSAHTYDLLLGYGAPWRDMVTQNWRLQAELFADKKKSYLVSEYAIIGRQNPETDEAKIFINKASYELPDEAAALGRCFTDEEWELSQAFQGLCAKVATKQLLRYDADGMLWCCLWGGANNASYLKPIVDFYGYKKLAYYVLTEAFEEAVCFNERPDVLWYSDYTIRPIVCGLQKGREYEVRIEIEGEDKQRYVKKYPKFVARSVRKTLREWKPKLRDEGYYKVTYILTAL